MGEKALAQDKLETALRINSDFPEALKFYRDVNGREYPVEKKAKVARTAAQSVKDV
jgi:hypothetical protein